MGLCTKGSLSPSDSWDIGTLVLSGFWSLLLVLRGASFASMGVPTRARTSGLAFSLTHWANRSFGLMPRWADSMTITLKMFGSKSTLGLWAFVIMYHWDKRYLKELVQWDNMTLIDLAGKDRNKRDAILKIATGILTLQDIITEKQDAIREQAIIEMNDEFVPTVTGFKDSDLVERLQEEIAISANNREQLQAIVDEIEAAFTSCGLPAMSMETLNLRIDEGRDRATDIARQINRLARKLLQDNPALTLVELYSDVELQALEGTRAAAIIEGNAEAAKLIELKDRLLPLCADGSVIAEAVFHPMRAAVSDPTRISQLRSA